MALFFSSVEKVEDKESDMPQTPLGSQALC